MSASKARERRALVLLEELQAAIRGFAQRAEDLEPAWKDWLKAQGKPVSCAGVGCHGCCRGDIQTTWLEVLMMRPSIPPEVLERLPPPPPTQKERERAWCPLLVDGRCSVYAHRPLICRGWFAITPKEWCHAELGERIAAWVIPPDIREVIMLVEPKMSNMHEMLWKMKNNQMPNVITLVGEYDG